MRVASALVAAAAGVALHIAQPNAASAQTRAECEEGIRFIRNELSRAVNADQRAILTKALRDAERELGEEEYDECLDAVDDAKSVSSGQPPATARVREPAEALQADAGLPISVEDAFVPRPREIEATSRFVYDRVRRRTTGEEDEGTLRRSGRNRYTPGVEMEVGIVPGLSAMLGAEYRLRRCRRNQERGSRVRRQVELPVCPGLAAGARGQRQRIPALRLPERFSRIVRRTARQHAARRRRRSAVHPRERHLDARVRHRRGRPQKTASTASSDLPCQLWPRPPYCSMSCANRSRSDAG
jgi:hypothetical protein